MSADMAHSAAGMAQKCRSWRRVPVWRRGVAPKVGSNVSGRHPVFSPRHRSWCYSKKYLL